MSKKTKKLFHVDVDMQDFFILSYSASEALQIALNQRQTFSAFDSEMIIRYVCNEKDFINNENSIITNKTFKNE